MLLSQEVFYFPLRERLLALLRVPVFRKLLEYEYRRPKPRNHKIMSDVYDGQAWQEFIGPTTTPLQHIILHFCMDGFPAFQCGSHSVKPAMFIDYSLAPLLRAKAEFMMLYLLLPTHLKGGALKKFFDYVARRELNDLYETGVDSCFFNLFCLLSFLCHN